MGWEIRSTPTRFRLRRSPSQILMKGGKSRLVRTQSNLRLLLTRFNMVGKGSPPCSGHPSATSIAAQQNR